MYSSSSFYQYEYAKLIPFIFTKEENKSIFTTCTYNEYIFTNGIENNNGIVLRSKDRFKWETFFTSEDPLVTAINVFENFLFVGTSPNGYIYKINLSTLETKTYTFFGNVSFFVNFHGNLYAITSNKSNIYVYNKSLDTFVKIFTPPFNKINFCDIIENTMYITGEGMNVLIFNGNTWYLRTNNIPNRLATNLISNTASNLTKKMYSGIKSFVYDDGVVLYGTMNDGKVYSSDKIVLETQGNSVNYLLNIEDETNLVAIDNKLFLLYIKDTTTDDGDNSSSSSEVKANEIVKNIELTYPTSNNKFSIGDTMIITWVSNKGTNDSVKLSLYNNGKEYQIINGNAKNSGTYEWDIPLSLPIGDYQIYIEWLSAQVAQEENKDFSDSFLILNEVPDSSSSESVSYSEIINKSYITKKETPKYSSVQILSLEDETITYLSKDEYNGILIGTSNGRIISCNKSYFNAFLTGTRSVYANIWNGSGHKSNTAIYNFMYAIHNRILQVNEEKEIINKKYFNGYSAFKNDKIEGVFISEPLIVNNDFGMWNSLLWTETKDKNDRIIIYLRNSNSLDNLYNSKWSNSFESDNSESGFITRDLSSKNYIGQYMQIMVKIISNNSVSPIVSDINLTYFNQKSYYFYTTKLSLEKDTSIKNGLIVASISNPLNTEVKFGLSEINSNNWNDYKVIDMNKLFSINNYKNIKIGIKLIPYGNSTPRVDEFALFIGDEKKQIFEGE